MEVPENGWFLLGKIPLKWMMNRGTTIYGNPHVSAATLASNIGNQVKLYWRIISRTLKFDSVPTTKNRIPEKNMWFALPKTVGFKLSPTSKRLTIVSHDYEIWSIKQSTKNMVSLTIRGNATNQSWLGLIGPYSDNFEGKKTQLLQLKSHLSVWNWPQKNREFLLMLRKKIAWSCHFPVKKLAKLPISGAIPRMWGCPKMGVPPIISYL